MSALAFSMTRPRVLFPAVLGGFFLLVKGWMVAGVVLLAIAAMKLLHLLGDDGLEARWQKQRERERFGVRRQLSYGERQELDALERYSDALQSRGVEPRLWREVKEQAWEIIRRAGPNDATVQLRVFRQSLPEVSAAGPAQEPLHERLRRELDLLNASEREVEKSSQAQ
jgi:hypothetical protein